jgi:hypothetical protein
MAIAVKRGKYEEEDAKVKLAVWTVAWQNRIAAFRLAKRIIFPALPAMLVFGHIWELYWVVDKGDKVDIVLFPAIAGKTMNMVGCYRLVAVIRYLVGVWVPEVYEPWFKKEILELDE